MTSNDGTQWLYDRINYETLASPTPRYRFTLDRMRTLVRQLGYEQFLSQDAPLQKTADLNRPLVVHIAGTKGKGSVATMVASILTAAGYRTGLYTSPHLMHLSERFRVDGRVASEEQLRSSIQRIQTVVTELEKQENLRPSFFELTTAIAIDHFRANHCQAWVLETGLGGRLDSTNVFQSDVTAITTIGLDHQHVLGDTREKIAAEKAGIIKSGIPVINGVTDAACRSVIQSIADQQRAPVTQRGRDFDLLDDRPLVGWGRLFQVDGLEPFIRPDQSLELPLEGSHQARNAAVALAIINALQDRLPTTFDEIATGLRGVRSQARLERFEMPDGTTVILDAAHNEDSIAALVEVIQARFSERQVGLIFGTSVDKDAAKMLQLLKPHLNALWLTQYRRNPRFVALESLSKTWSAIRGDSQLASVFTVQDCETACDQGLRWSADSTQSRRVLIICGSFFLAAELRPRLSEMASSASIERVFPNN